MVSMGQRMDKLILVLIIAFVVYGLALVFYTPPKKSADLQIVVYQIDDGFGYQISHRDKILIKQDHIPAIEEKKVFYSQKDAEQVALLVKSRLDQGESPLINIKDLKTMDIQLKHQSNDP